MTATTEEHEAYVDSLPAVISHEIVRLAHEHTGRGPTRARITIRDDVVVMVPDQTQTRVTRRWRAGSVSAST